MCIPSIHNDAELGGLSSTENVDKACQYAKNHGLNFVAVTDHAESSGNGKMTQTLWDNSIIPQIKAQSPNTYCAETSTFIPLIGYEWTSSTFGHKSVIFKNLDIPWSVVYSSYSGDGSRYKNYPTDLWSALDSAGYQSTAVTLPHHPAGGPAATNWDYQNPADQPGAEIYSEHGNKEGSG
ncbi:MAG: DUF3604 domain-containing protein [Nitrospirae bacterium]|nr:DUF3604 domain-containing protein [Nitrospirota bacterium]